MVVVCLVVVEVVGGGRESKGREQGASKSPDGRQQRAEEHHGCAIH
jgi:hypothetical protein